MEVEKESKCSLGRELINLTQMADVPFGADNGPKWDMAPGPKKAPMAGLATEDGLHCSERAEKVAFLNYAFADLASGRV